MKCGKNRRGRCLYPVKEATAIEPPERSGKWEQDLALALRAAGGDRSALHEVVDRHAKDLFRLARGLCPTPADAEDVVQETLIAVFRKIATFDGRASLLTWMSRILVRRTRKQWRKWGRVALPLDESRDAAGRGAEPLVAGPAPGVDCRLDVAAALPRLAPEFREVIVLRELQGLSYAEIAAALDIPRGTVESRIHRARSELRRRLHAYRP